jgi:hypothetical protein
MLLPTPAVVGGNVVPPLGVDSEPVPAPPLGGGTNVEPVPAAPVAPFPPGATKLVFDGGLEEQPAATSNANTPARIPV